MPPFLPASGTMALLPMGNFDIDLDKGVVKALNKLAGITRKDAVSFLMNLGSNKTEDTTGKLKF